MKIEGVLLRPTDRQLEAGRRDRYILSPDAVKIDPEAAVPVILNVNGNVNGPQVGTARIRFEDGQLLFTAEIDEGVALPETAYPALSAFGILKPDGEVLQVQANGVHLSESGNKDPGIEPYKAQP